MKRCDPDCTLEVPETVDVDFKVKEKFVLVSTCWCKGNLVWLTLCIGTEDCLGIGVIGLFSVFVASIRSCRLKAS